MWNIHISSLWLNQYTDIVTKESLNKMNPFLKSSEPDLKKLFKYLEMTHKNVLYITYQIDKIRRDINTMQTDKGLQKQVSNYFEEVPEAPALADLD